MNTLRQDLEERYKNLFRNHDLEEPIIDGKNITLIIKNSLQSFLINAKRPAIYGFGEHTVTLMADFIFELKKVKYIIDDTGLSGQSSGFTLITEDEIEKYEIDAIILSSIYNIRETLKKRLNSKYPQLPVLDIYDEFEKNGIKIQTEYYYVYHPYQYYMRINKLQREIAYTTDIQTLNTLYRELITKYLSLKDFRTASIKLNDWKNMEHLEEEKRNKLVHLQSDIDSLYNLLKKAAASLSEDHVLMFCFDALRKQDFSDSKMPKLKKLMNETGYQYDNAYSFSTSTYESLIPAYSGNSDLRTKYYEKNIIDSKSCPFISTAIQQNRSIYFYCDGTHYIENEQIHHQESFTTITQKLWDFILDAIETQQGLFYIHELSESHFSFPNPYTETELVSEGTSLWFDFLSPAGHCLTDYSKQLNESLRYLDDVVEPLLRPMKCKMLLYADHGNLIYDYDTKLSDIKNTDYFCSDYHIRIPFIIRSPQMGVGTDKHLISLMEINNIIINLLKSTTYHAPLVNHIKLARSTMYNPDFIKLYHIMGKAKYLQPFECFVFADNIKLVIFADGNYEVYTNEDQPLYDIDKKVLFNKIAEEITVFEYQAVKTLEKQLKDKFEKNLLFLTDSSDYENTGKINKLAELFRKAGYNTLILDIGKKQFPQQANILYHIPSDAKFNAVISCNPKGITDQRFLQFGEQTFVLMKDLPYSYDEQLKTFHKDTIIYCNDKNHVKYIQQYYPNIGKTLFSPQASCFLEEHITYSERGIEILLADDYLDPEVLYAQIGQKYTKEIFLLVEQLIHKLISCSYKTYEQALQETFEDYALDNITEEQFKIFSIEFQLINQYLQAYYNDLIIRQLLQHEIKLNVFGNGWENFKTENSAYLSIESWNWYTFQKALANAKIMLIIAPNFKNGLNDSIISGLMSGSVIVTNSNKYLEDNFTDMKNIVLYDLNNLETLPEKLKFLLDDQESALEIAQNGKNYAKEHFTWENNVKQMLKALNENGQIKQDPLIPGKELSIQFQEKQREEIAFDVSDEFSRIDHIISALQTCTTIRTEDYQYCIEHLTKAMQMFALDFPDSDNTKQMESMITQLKMKYGLSLT